MNILPKKRWHVRTKDNIARVRRDEAKAAEEEIERNRRIQLAEQEARTSVLRDQARLRLEGTSTAVEVPSDKNNSDVELRNLNLFPEVADGQKSFGANKEHETEKKEEQEKYEKSIGLLTYLGQTSLENKEQPWYYKAPEDRHMTNSDNKEEVKTKSKTFLDPLKDMRAYMKMLGEKSSPKQDKSKKKKVKVVIEKSHEKNESKRRHKSSKRKKSHKHGKHKQMRRDCSSSSSEESTKSKEETLNKLRAERLCREKQESLKAKSLLAKLDGGAGEVADTQKKSVPQSDGDQGYHSQFNPHLVRKRKP